MKYILCCGIIGIFVLFINCAELDSVSDDDLINLFKKDAHLVVLFSKRNCDECDKFEGLLFNLRDEIRESLDASVVKAFNSQMVRLYSPTKEPAVIYFRHGVPLLYDGPANEDSILDRFSQNKEPIVKELTDDIFEHLTQASTGSTTGDWFIMFYTQACVDCQRLAAVWEAVGSAVKSRINLARINKGTLGVATAKRFNIRKAPEFILIRQGKFYRYEIPKFDVKSFVSFAQEWYKNATPEKIEKPPTPFDNLVDLGVEYLKKFTTIGLILINDYPYILIFLICGFGLTLITALIAKYKASRNSKPDKKEKKKAK